MEFSKRIKYRKLGIFRIEIRLNLNKALLNRLKE